MNTTLNRCAQLQKGQYGFKRWISAPRVCHHWSHLVEKLSLSFGWEFAIIGLIWLRNHCHHHRCHLVGSLSSLVSFGWEIVVIIVGVIWLGVCHHRSHLVEKSTSSSSVSFGWEFVIIGLIWLRNHCHRHRCHLVGSSSSSSSVGSRWCDVITLWRDVKIDSANKSPGVNSTNWLAQSSCWKEGGKWKILDYKVIRDLVIQWDRRTYRHTDRER